MPSDHPRLLGTPALPQAIARCDGHRAPLGCLERITIAADYPGCSSCGRPIDRTAVRVGPPNYPVTTHGHAPHLGWGPKSPGSMSLVVVQETIARVMLAIVANAGSTAAGGTGPSAHA